MIIRIGIAVSIIALVLASFAAGRYLLPAGDPSEADYYRGVYDLCRFMVAATGEYVDCNKMAGVAHDYDWFEDVSRGFEWPVK